eukprot:CAMPEP_0113455578 /NCGR_PEP_ID=MMETSP0014_2-20120614/8447_1 /TAXON_ID=2857 /ORGANISM="Nitzschia sp." /LENGTH=321 /DNA_ID=CAMNT_0000347011 /DNA_START=401 /DNA_END=1366 /DNA_ORIENTATION=+ /assembly_acc=CAM_ASM_000159
MPLSSTHGDSHYYSNDDNNNVTDTFSPTTPVQHNGFGASSSLSPLSPASSYSDVRRTNRTKFSGNETNEGHNISEFGPSDRVSMILLLLGFLILLTLSLFFAVKSYNSPRVAPNAQAQQQGQQERPDKKDENRPTIEKARRALVQFFEKNENQMVVVLKGDCTYNNDGGAGSSRSDDEPRDIENHISESISKHDNVEGGIDENDNIPTTQRPELNVLRRKLSSSTDGVDEQLDVPDCCTICLEPYIVGESIVWSLNEECHHVYHKDCVIDYFAYKMNKGHPCLCPTCRRKYCSVEVKDPDVENTETIDYDIEQPQQQQVEQ